jgi:hypothetical protein
MTEEDKELLLRDLCGRQMYNVKCQVFNDVNPYTLSGILHNKPHSQLYFEELDWKEYDGFVNVEYCKPYLFPLSSMTEEQKKKYNFWKHEIPVCRYEYGDAVEEIELFESPESFEYLIENHFDVFGLIPLGLAIDATNLNIY